MQLMLQLFVLYFSSQLYTPGMQSRSLLTNELESSRGESPFFAYVTRCLTGIIQRNISCDYARFQVLLESRCHLRVPSCVMQRTWSNCYGTVTTFRCDLVLPLLF